jgi:hypothetical protein
VVQGAVERGLSDAHPAYDDLVANCRNTRQVSAQASIILGIDLALRGGDWGMTYASLE